MKLKWLSFIFLFYFLFLGIGGISFGDDECPEVVDAEQLKCDVTAGFGEFDKSEGKGGVRYRGQGATPGENIKAWTSIEFNIPPSNTDLRVFIDTADSNSIPEHGIDGAMFSFTIPNSELKEGTKKYYFSEEFPVITGTQYVVYLAPYKNGVYCDDYRDLKWGSNNPYQGGKGVVNINGCWIVSDLSSGTIDMKVKLYGKESECGESTPEPTPTGTEEPTPIPTPTDDGGGGGGGGDDGGGGGGGGKELRVIGTKPGSGETDVDPNLNKIEVSFNLAMDESGFITASAMALKEKESGTEVTVLKAEVLFGGIVNFYLSSGSLVSGTEYEVKIIKDRVKAGVGETPSLKEDYIWTFTTAAEAQPTPTPTPTVTIEPTPSPSPTSSSSPTPTPTPSAEPSPIFTPTPAPTPIPEKGVIYGRVRNIHEPEKFLGGVGVALSKREKSERGKWVWKKYAQTETTRKGKYRFEELPKGRYKLRFTKPPYWLPLTKKVSLKEGGVREVNILLDP